MTNEIVKLENTIKGLIGPRVPVIHEDDAEALVQDLLNIEHSLELRAHGGEGSQRAAALLKTVRDYRGLLAPAIAADKWVDATTGGSLRPDTKQLGLAIEIQLKLVTEREATWQRLSTTTNATLLRRNVQTSRARLRRLLGLDASQGRRALLDSLKEWFADWTLRNLEGQRPIEEQVRHGLDLLERVSAYTSEMGDPAEDPLGRAKLLDEIHHWEQRIEQALLHHETRPGDAVDDDDVTDDDVEEEEEEEDEVPIRRHRTRPSPSTRWWPLGQLISVLLFRRAWAQPLDVVGLVPHIHGPRVLLRLSNAMGPGEFDAAWVELARVRLGMTVRDATEARHLLFFAAFVRASMANVMLDSVAHALVELDIIPVRFGPVDPAKHLVPVNGQVWLPVTEPWAHRLPPAQLGERLDARRPLKLGME